MTLPARRSSRSFTLVELLVVIAIMAIMAAVAVPAMKGINGAGQFTKATRQIAGALDQARSYAVAQNTYVWVSLYSYQPTSPPNSPPVLYIAAFASNDGTDPLGVGKDGNIHDNQNGTYSVTAEATSGQPSPTTTISSIMPPLSFSALTYSSAGDPKVAVYPSPSYDVKNPQNPSPAPASPLKAPAFPLTLGSVTLGAGQSQVLAVLEFLPSGAVQTDAEPGNTALIASTALILQPALSATQNDTNNVSTVWINGLTGLTTVYRK